MFKLGRSRYLIVFLAFVLLASVTGCTAKKTETPNNNPSESEAPAEGTPTRGGTATLALYQPPNTCIEYFSLGNQAIAPARLIYSSLLRLGGTGTYVPDLAKEHTVSPDEKGLPGGDHDPDLHPGPEGAAL